MSNAGKSSDKSESPVKQASKQPATPEMAGMEQQSDELASLQRAWSDPGSIKPKDVLHLQRTVGNRVVNKLLTNGPQKRNSDGGLVRPSLVNSALRTPDSAVVPPVQRAGGLLPEGGSSGDDDKKKKMTVLKEKIAPKIKEAKKLKAIHDNYKEHEENLAGKGWRTYFRFKKKIDKVLDIASESDPTQISRGLKYASSAATMGKEVHQFAKNKELKKELSPVLEKEGKSSDEFAGEEDALAMELDAFAIVVQDGVAEFPDIDFPMADED